MGASQVVTYVEDEVEIANLVCMEWTDIHRRAEGVGIGVSGTSDGEQQTWIFETEALQIKGITRFKSSGYFYKNDERWDFVKGYPVTANTGPQGATNPITYIYVRRAAEFKNTVRGDGFGFNLEE